MATETAPQKNDAPNWYDGPMTFWAVVDKDGQAFGFGSERHAADLLERWEQRLPKYGPYRIIKLLEQRKPF